MLNVKTPVFCFLFLILFISDVNAQIEQLLSKTFISLTGKLPAKSVKEYFLNKENTYNSKKIIDSLLNKVEFYQFMESKLRSEYLEGLSQEYLYEKILDYYFLYSTRDGSMLQNQFKKNFVNLDYIGRFTIGKNEVDSTDVEMIQKALLSSVLYDEINMGSVNYVTSIFQHLLNRKPTNYELNEGQKIVEGKQGVLFGAHGMSKKDFLNILFNNTEFRENQIRYWYSYFNNEEINRSELEILLLSDVKTCNMLIKSILLEQWSRK